MKSFKILLLSIFLTSSLNLSANDCLIKCADFGEVLDVIEKYYPKVQRPDNLTKFRKWYQSPKYKFAADTLYQFAKNIFSEKLPEELLCSRVGISSNYSFAGLYGNHPKLLFTFNLDENPSARAGNEVLYSFSMDLKKKSISYYETPRNLWLPDCKNFPDSCNFKVSKRSEAIKILKEKGIIEDKHYRYSYPKNFLPFHFNLPVKMPEDCMMKDYSISMYSGEITISETYQRAGCLTIENMVNQADLVIQGEVRGIKDEYDRSGSYFPIKKGIMLNGEIFTSVEIEVQKVFKGEVNSPVIEGLKRGGDVGNISSSLSHGAISPGYPGSPFIFFLKNKDAYPSDKPEKLDSLTLFPLYFFSSNSIPVYDANNYRSYAGEIDKKLYRRIEAVAGREEVTIRMPETRNKKIVNWLVENRKTVPDRSSGLAFTLHNSGIDENDFLQLSVYVADANRHSYLKNWTLRVSYNAKAFGENLILNKKLKYEFFGNKPEHKSYQVYPFRLPENYIIDLNQETDSTFLIHFEKPLKTDRYFQVLPSNISQIKLIDLKFPVLSERENSNFEIEPVGEPIAVDLKTETEKKFDYVFTSPEIKNTPRSYREAELTDFYPKSVSVGDTVTIEGNYLENATVGLRGRSLNGRSFYGNIPRKMKIDKTENRIRFIIPKNLKMPASSHAGTEPFFPATGKIYLTKEYVRLTSSKIDLEILDD